MLKKIAGWIILIGVNLAIFGPIFWNAISKQGWLAGILSIVVSFMVIALFILLMNIAYNLITDDKK